MSGGGKSGGDSYWPGFVDALTNVVIAMIFVVVVLAISLSFAAQLMGKKIAEQIIQEHQAKTAQGPPQPELGSPVQPGPAPAEAPSVRPSAPSAPPAEPLPELRESALKGVTRIAVAAPARPASMPMPSMKPVQNRLQLDYERQALELDDKARGALRDALVPLGGSLGQRQVTLVATTPDPQLSDNQRAAYVRLLAVRNALMEQGMDPARVQMRVDTTTATPGPSVFVSFE